MIDLRSKLGKPCARTIDCAASQAHPDAHVRGPIAVRKQPVVVRGEADGQEQDEEQPAELAPFGEESVGNATGQRKRQRNNEGEAVATLRPQLEALARRVHVSHTLQQSQGVLCCIMRGNCARGHDDRSPQ